MIVRYQHMHSHRARGFTLVEIMVAMAISLVLVLAAMAAMLMSSRGYSTVDSSAQLRQNAGFVVALIGGVAAQAGFKDVHYATRLTTTLEKASAMPGITGFNNATFNGTPQISSETLNSVSWTGGKPGFGSDILVVRYQPVGRGAEDPDSDGSMVDCSGVAPKTPSASRGDTAISIFYIAGDVDGEPALFCAALDSGRTAFKSPYALVRGVESFQVLYGVQANTPVANELFSSTKDAIPRAYLRADQMLVDGPNGAKTRSNWQLVRSIRIGMVLRGEVNRQQQAQVQSFYPFGVAKANATGVAGSAFASADDAGTNFVAPADGRFRTAETFTIHLRNAQGI